MLAFISSSFSFAKTCENLSNCVNNECKTVAGEEVCVEVKEETVVDKCEEENDIGRISQWENNSCPSGYEPAASGCCKPASENITPTNEANSVMGITCSSEQLVNGQCKLNIYDTLGIRKSVRDTDDPTSVGLFVQDIVLSATFFIGTLVTIALIVSGLMFIFAASSGKDPANAKKWIMWSLIGLLIVASSYVIIRLVQYIAKGF